MLSERFSPGNLGKKSELCVLNFGYRQQPSPLILGRPATQGSRTFFNKTSQISERYSVSST